ncbi:CUE domain-containing protein 2 isoform X5 [Narcine bancroftii]|uniref:CUE domain-containing protein 2 isoform X5 n=1 Tax=Narcine bancroftii TaxID=1343680 RepID=UPI003831CBD8
MRWAGACPRRDLERAISFRVGRLAAGNGVASCTSSPADTMAMEKIIRDSLAQFVHSYIPDADFGVAIYEMMFDLAAQLIEARNKENVPPPVCSQDTVSSLNKQQMSDWEQKSSVELESGFVAGVGATAKEAGVEKEDGIQLLVEMFPSCSVSTMRHALSVAKGDMDYAVQLIIEGSVEGLDTPTSEEARPKTDKKIKASILEKYMMVDNEEDVKIHKPIAPKEAPKKLIRYIDNQVVSTKGERYTEVKKAESDEMKKTYINLKPARKYKFH